MKPIIIANWKMNPSTLEQAKVLFLAAEKVAKSGKAEVVVCPPYPYLVSLQRIQKNVLLGAQDCSWEQKGALTGEVSPVQLKNIGCRFVVIGHSERKKYLGETLGMTQEKIVAALKVRLQVILCIERITELEAIKKRLRSFKNILIVFEPSFAISTQGGKHVAPKDIANMVKTIKVMAGKNVSVLYGGSVNSKSIGNIMTEGNVDGVLVGAASLKPEEFAGLVKNSVVE